MKKSVSISASLLVSFGGSVDVSFPKPGDAAMSSGGFVFCADVSGGTSEAGWADSCDSFWAVVR